MCGRVFDLAFLLTVDIINIIKILAVTIFVLLEFRRSLAYFRVCSWFGFLSCCRVLPFSWSHCLLVFCAMFTHFLSICNKHSILDIASFSLLETFLSKLLSVCWGLTVLASLTLDAFRVRCPVLGSDSLASDSGRPPCVGVPCWGLTLWCLWLWTPSVCGVPCWGCQVSQSLSFWPFQFYVFVVKSSLSLKLQKYFVYFSNSFVACGLSLII